MTASKHEGGRLRAKAGRPDRTRVAYVPIATEAEEIPVHCFAMGSLRSRR